MKWDGADDVDVLKTHSSTLQTTKRDNVMTIMTMRIIMCNYGIIVRVE